MSCRWICACSRIYRNSNEYSFNPKLRDYGRPIGFDVFHADVKDILRMPLVHHPGDNWEYGVRPPTSHFETTSSFAN